MAYTSDPLKAFSGTIQRRGEFHTIYWTQFLRSKATVGDSPKELSLTQEYICYDLRDRMSAFVVSVHGS